MARSIGRNAASNLIAGVLPAVASLVTMPFIVHGLGSDAYGLMALITSITGYFALVDLNVTAGSVKHIAHHHALGEQDAVSRVFSFGAVVYIGIGLVGAVPLWCLAEWLPRAAFKVPAAMQDLAAGTLRVAAFGFFFGQLQSYLQSVPQALLRYDVSGRLESTFGLLVPLVNVCQIALGQGLREVVLARVLLSVVNCALLLVAARQLLPGLRWRRPDRNTVAEISSFSAYAFLNRVAAVSYAQADRLIIGAMLGLTPLAYYTVAATLGNRILSLMFRVSAVMFPAASALGAKGDSETLRRLYLRMCRYVSFANACALLLVMAFARPVLARWMGADFAANGTLVLQLVALAQFLDSLTNIPSLVNDGLGHPRVSGAFAISRALLGLVAVYLCILAWGLTGAAASHVISSAVMTSAFLAYVHGRTVPCEMRRVWAEAYRPALPLLAVGGLFAALLLPVASRSVGMLIALVVALSALLAAGGIRWILMPTDRATLHSYLQRLTGRGA